MARPQVTTLVFSIFFNLIPFIKKTKTMVFWILPFAFQWLPLSAFAQVTGYIDSVSLANAEVRIAGWACEHGNNTPVNIHIYAGGSAGSGSLIKTIMANGSSEPAVSTACKTSGVSHRFRVVLSPSEWMPYTDKAVYIHGISPSKKYSNSLIRNSGKYTLPKVSSNTLMVGHIDSVSLTGTEVQISGWTCERGNHSSANIHIYAGGAAGVGTFVKSFAANLTSEPAVSSECKTSGVKHRFKALLSSSEWTPYKNKKIHIHGIIPDQDYASNAVTNSGKYAFPSVSANLKLSGLPYKDNEDLVIPADSLVTLDRNINVRHLIINGTLTCPKTGAHTLSAKAISVYGVFECGSVSSRFTGSLDVRLRPGLELESKHGKLGERAFLIHAGGVLNLYGKNENAGWQRITKTAEAGSSSVRLEKAISWKAGDLVVLSSTSFDMNEAERLTVSSVSADGLTVSFKEALKFSHWGEFQNYQALGKTWVLDQRAQIANLTRNIRILPYEGEFQNDQRGGHVMVMVGGKASVDSVEFINMGRMGEMARYPFHWHFVGNAEGQFLVNSSIRDSFQRCVTVHATNYARVENNVCYNHYGHGYFLEHGSERKNIIKGNLGLVSKRPLANRHLLESDIKGVSGRFPAPSTFWISNPDNTIEGNVAAGSEGTGFWMAFENKYLCNKDLCGTPLTLSTLSFNDNEAHSSKVGITWDGAPGNVSADNPRNNLDNRIENAHYNPAQKPVFKNLIAYKNYEAGLYFRGNAAEFRSTIVADNAWSLFFAYSQAVVDSIVIGQSRNISDKDRDKLRSSRKGAGIVAYDGPFELSNVAFLNFPTSSLIHGDKDITPYPIIAIGGADRFENKVQGLQFSPEPLKRVHLDLEGETATGWTDAPYSISIRDLDGSLTGSAGSLVVPLNDFNKQTNCREEKAWKALVCPYDIVLFTFRVLNQEDAVRLNIDSNKIQFIPEVNGLKPYSSVSEMKGSYHNKFQAVLDTSKTYTLHPGSQFLQLKRFSVIMHAEGSGVTGPVLRLKGLGKCYPESGSTALASLKEFMASDQSSYFQADGDLYLRLRTNVTFWWHRYALLSKVHNAVIGITCPQ